MRVGDRPSSRRVRAWAAASVIVCTAVAGPLPVAARQPADPDEPSAAAAEALTELREDTRGAARIATDPETGSLRFVGAPAGRSITPPRDEDPGAVSRSFVDEYGAAFGVAEPDEELVETARTETLNGVSVRYQQQHEGIPVLAGDVVVAVGVDGAVDASAGETSRHLDVPTTPQVDPAAAVATAIGITARDHGLAAVSLRATEPELWIYDPTLLDADALPIVRLVWRVEVATAVGDVDRFVLVDAITGVVALQFDQVHAALDRRVCDNQRLANLPEQCVSPVIVEGGSRAGVSSEALAAYDNTQRVHAYFSQILGRVSLLPGDEPVLSTVGFCPPTGPSFCSYQNAFWNGSQMVYGQGWASALDIVGHELTHGITQHTANLLYFGESGAINESISDVLGEIIQLTNLPAGSQHTRWIVGEDSPIGMLRSLSDPGFLDDPDRMTSDDFHDDQRDHYGVHHNSGVSNKAAYLMATGGTFNGRNMGAGIGLDKTARVYFHALTSLLASGSDYRDLSLVLPQACTALIGTGGITAANCDIVQAAVLATEMHLPPAKAGANLRRDPCDAGQSIVPVFEDDVEGVSPRWTTGGDAAAAWTVGRARSSDRALLGPDLAVTAESWIRLAQPVVIPATGTTYFQFEHAFQFDHTVASNGMPDSFWDGGLVRYRTSSGPGTPADLAARPGVTVVNGYNGNISEFATTPLRNQPAFTAESPGWQTTRFDVSSLAGETVWFEFYIASDEIFGAGGWFVDDVSVHQCTGPQPTTSTPTSTPTTTPTTTTPPTSTSVATGPPPVPPPPTSTSEAPGLLPGGDLVPIAPCRIADTRPAPYTVGPRAIPLAAGETLAVGVWGTNGDCTIPPTAAAVVMNLTATGAHAGGFVTAFPCDSTRPNASSLNHAAGQTAGNAVISKLSADGRLCLYSHAATDLIVDLNGWFPAGQAYSPLVPARVLETRPGYATVDGAFNGNGRREAGSLLELQLAGRGGVPGAGASAVAFNLTVAGAAEGGFVTAFPCDSARPNASSLNYAAGQTVGNTVISKLSADGKVCLFAFGATDLIVDVSGWFPTASGYRPVVPARLLETRPGFTTVDGEAAGIGPIGAGTTLRLQVAGRGGVPSSGAAAVAMNVTVANGADGGFLTVFPCDGQRPNASNLNHGPDQTVGNSVTAKLASDGSVCVYSLATTDVIVDLNGWFAAG